MEELKGTKIKIIGVGGAGGNVVNGLINQHIDGVSFVCVNTDNQDLAKNNAQEKVLLEIPNENGEKKLLGAGGDPTVGRQAAEEKVKEIKKVVEEQDLIFITAGMGGGTGTGAAPIVARLAKESGALTIAVVTKPFKFEGKKRKINAEYGLEELQKYVDTLIVIPNQKIFDLDETFDLGFEAGLERSNELLYFGIKGISDLITKTGRINLDFSDVKSIMKDSGIALFGLADSQEGETLEDLVERIIKNPLLERDIKGATKVLINITAGRNLTGRMVSTICELISIKASGDPDGVDNLMFGHTIEEGKQNITISMIATGFEEETEELQTMEKEQVTEFFKEGTVSDYIVPRMND